MQGPGLDVIGQGGEPHHRQPPADQVGLAAEHGLDAATTRLAIRSMLDEQPLGLRGGRPARAVRPELLAALEVLMDLAATNNSHAQFIGLAPVCRRMSGSLQLSICAFSPSCKTGWRVETQRRRDGEPAIRCMAKIRPAA
jgi:hypothetical protein